MNAFVISFKTIHLEVFVRACLNRRGLVKVVAAQHFFKIEDTSVVTSLQGEFYLAFVGGCTNCGL